ncbi:MAG TPA: alpha/beta hydrolase [Candidatus Dormibacteraeota bacterium]|nr:alpha/beta hydrolase [Candidatus Dormibacteraeota bacterium]
MDNQETFHLQEMKKSKARRKYSISLFVLVLLLVIIAVLRWGGQTSEDSGLPLFELKKPKPVGGEIVELKHTGTLNAAAINTEAAVVYGPTGVQTAKTAIEKYEVTYTSQDPRNGKEVNIKGRFYIPQQPYFGNAIVFGPGTTGPGAECAPTLERARGKNWSRYDNHLSFYAGQGYAVATTDYDNRLPGGIQAYFVGEFEGRIMLDTARAMQKLKDERIPGYIHPKGFVMAGYSQGGHAALWADQIRRDYAEEIDINAIAGFVPAADVGKLVKDAVSGATATWLPPYLLAAYRDYYELPTLPLDMLQEPHAQTLETDARSLCIDQVEIMAGRFGNKSTVDKVYQPEFLKAARGDTLELLVPEFERLMRKNLAGDYSSKTPVLTISGERDTVVLPNSQLQLTQRLCRNNSSRSVQLFVSPAATHYTAMAAGRNKVLEWLKQIESPLAPATDCSRYRQ